MNRAWVPLVVVLFLLAPSAASAQMRGSRGGLLPVPSLSFLPPYGLPVVSPTYYPYGVNLSPYAMNPSVADQLGAYGLPLLPSDLLPGRRNRTRNGPGRPQQKIEEFDPPAKSSAKPAAGAVTKAAAGHIEARVPADAEVWFDGEKSSETGAVRRFESPPIAPGESVSVEVKVRKRGPLQDTDAIRHVTLRAGQRLTVDLMPRAEAPARPERK